MYIHMYPHISTTIWNVAIWKNTYSGSFFKISCVFQYIILFCSNSDFRTTYSITFTSEFQIKALLAGWPQVVLKNLVISFLCNKNVPNSNCIFMCKSVSSYWMWFFLLLAVMGKAEGSVAREEWHGHVTALSVAPEFRRLGLAAKLMELLEEISERWDSVFQIHLGICGPLTIFFPFRLNNCHALQFIGISCSSISNSPYNNSVT